jgi:hypothetical protein
MCHDRSSAHQQRQAPVVRLRQKQIELHARVHGADELIVAAAGAVPFCEAVGVSLAHTL